MSSKPELPEDVRTSLEALVEYSWADELEDAERHYHENDGDLAGHAFEHLVTIDNWLNGISVRPLQYIFPDGRSS